MRGLVRTTGLVGNWEDLYDKAPLFGSYPGYTTVHVGYKYALREHKDLSPFKLGPILTSDPDYPECKNMENLWGWVKVFKSDISKKDWASYSNFNQDKPNDFFSYTGKVSYPDPSKRYFRGRQRGFASAEVNKTRLKKSKKDIDNFLYCWYRGDKEYDFIECRKFFYCYFYAKEVQKTDAYKSIKKRLDSGENLCLTGWDAFEWSEEDDDPNLFQMKQVLNDKDKIFGHEMVLAGMLLGNRIWE